MGLVIWSVSPVRTIYVLLPKMVDKRRINPTSFECKSRSIRVSSFSTDSFFNPTITRPSSVAFGNPQLLLLVSKFRGQKVFQFGRTASQPVAIMATQTMRCFAIGIGSCSKGRVHRFNSQTTRTLGGTGSDIFCFLEMCVLYIRKTEWKHLTHVFSSGFFVERYFCVVWTFTNKHQVIGSQKGKGIPDFRSNDEDISRRLLNSHSIPFNYSRKDKLGR